MTKMIPSEFRERTAYLSLALPQSRPSFYFGKFLGGMIVQIFVFALAYAVVSLVTVSQKGSMDGGIVLSVSPLPWSADSPSVRRHLH
ncbi:MAG: ABC transporter permease subunit, partial [Candidatus Methanomethylophilaceae archaeon]